VYALCSNCGAMLEKRKQRLSCSKGGKTEKRKVAVDYGKGIR